MANISLDNIGNAAKGINNFISKKDNVFNELIDALKSTNHRAVRYFWITVIMCLLLGFSAVLFFNKNIYFELISNELISTIIFYTLSSLMTGPIAYFVMMILKFSDYFGGTVWDIKKSIRGHKHLYPKTRQFIVKFLWYRFSLYFFIVLFPLFSSFLLAFSLSTKEYGFVLACILVVFFAIYCGVFTIRKNYSHELVVIDIFNEAPAELLKNSKMTILDGNELFYSANNKCFLLKTDKFYQLQLSISLDEYKELELIKFNIEEELSIIEFVISKSKAKEEKERLNKDKQGLFKFLKEIDEIITSFDVF